MASLPKEISRRLLHKLGDIVARPESIDNLKNEEVLRKSLLRDISLSIAKGQFARALKGKPELTDYKFKFARLEAKSLGGIEIEFNVKAYSRPSTNIHALIGRNGVGKTTILNGMIRAVMAKDNSPGKFYDCSSREESEIPSDYFSNLVSVSFSAFDPFSPPKEQFDPTRGACYYYVGLKDLDDQNRLRTISDLHSDCVRALIKCFIDRKKAKRWLDAIEKLGSDSVFASFGLECLEKEFHDFQKKPPKGSPQDPEGLQLDFIHIILPFIEQLSSGHAVVFLTITRLVASVEEKTLVLIDEPESHLHPPLLSAFVRALSDLLHDRNGVAIIATHSPVVLQEIPRSCVWKIYRAGQSTSVERPSTETFGENVGTLTSEVFGLEVEHSGFHDLLSHSVASGSSYSEILSSYDGQLGFEGRAVLKALIADRERSNKNDEA
jgi:predicted ATPase